MDPQTGSTSDDGRAAAARRAARFRIVDPALQGRLRAAIRAALDDAAIPADTVDDVLIVVSELLSNAHEHAGADEVSIELATHDHEIWALVAYQAPVVAELDESNPAAMPAASAARGRGLAIVDALTTTCRHRRQGDTFGTECTFAYG